MARNLSANGLNLIKSFESCKLTAYKCLPTEKYYTIGYGHYGSDVTAGMKITKEKAEELTSQESVVLPAIQLVLQVIHENICEEDFIRLILRLLTLFMQVRNRPFFVNCRNIPDFCRLCILNILVVVSSYQECQ